MTEIKRKELKLEGATEVSRSHPDQIVPPGLVKLRNAVVSRSDNVPGMRPDFRTASWLPTTRAGDWQGDWAGTPDFVNRMIWSFASDEAVHCSRMWPFYEDTGTVVTMCGEYAVGTVSCGSGGVLLTGTDTEFLANVWPGCWFGLDDGSGNLYLVAAVDSDTSLTLDTSPGALTDENYTIFQTWHPNAGLWPVKVERFITSVIANPVVPVAPIDANRVAGPFVAALEEVDYATYEWVAQQVTEALGVNLNGVCNYPAKQLDPENNQFVIPFGNSGTILHGTGATTDANGHVLHTWEKATSGTTAHLYFGASTQRTDGQVVNDNDQRIFIVGANATVLTAPADQSAWTAKTPNTSGNLYGVWCWYTGTPPTNKFSFFICGAGGVIEVTDDYGTTFTTLTSGTTQDLYSIVFHQVNRGTGVLTDTQIGIAVGANGTIVRAVQDYYDDAVDYVFEEVDSGTTQNLRCVYAATDLGGVGGILYPYFWAVGDNNTFLFSADMGETWEDGTMLVGSDGDYNATCLTDVTTGPRLIYLAGDDGRIETSIADYVIAETITTTTQNVNGIIGLTATYQVNKPIAACNSGILLYGVGTSETTFGKAKAMSGTYRAHAFCQAGGYMVYGGMMEYNEALSSFQFKPRRIRWAAPGTIADFASAGAGWVDLKGAGQILDLCAVGNAIIVGETDRISTLTPGSSSTWDHRSLAEGLWQLSNMVTLNEVVYFVASDGLLYSATPAGVQRVESGFDLSVGNDWEISSASPIAICYSPSLQALLIFRVADPYKLHLVEPEGGQHAVWELPEITISDVTYTPAMVSNLRTTEDDLLMVHYSETDEQTELLTLELKYGTAIKGIDDISSSDEGRWSTVIETGLLRFGQVGETVEVKDIEVHTFCWDTSEIDEFGASAPTLTAPDVLVEIRSNEDNSWRPVRETGTVTVGLATCVGSGTTFSNLIGLGTAGGQTVYSTPCRAAKARVYTETGGTYTNVTAFTVSGTHEITFTTAPTAGHGVYVFWQGEPQVTTAAGDYVRSSEGLHRITVVDDYQNLTLDWYPTEELTGTIVKAQQAAAGRKILTFGVGQKVEELAMRISMVSRNAATSAATAKLKRAVVSYVETGDEQKTDD